MKMKRLIAMVLVLCAILALLPAVSFRAEATGQVNYIKTGNYVHNWGTRSEVATFLSPMAEAFYEDNDIAYSDFTGLSGSSTLADVPSSDLYDALYEVMDANHTTMTSYGDVRYVSAYTDCEKSDSSQIVLFYKGTLISSVWDYGDTWQREHTWPNSKSDSGSTSIPNPQKSRETDIMLLRPANPSNNMSRSNTPYGESSGYFHPNSFRSVSSHDVRGDVARTMLYVYVRWGGDSQYSDGALNYMWGKSGVVESKEVLLRWMEEDPVDTWEMGRNDAVESITGTRNVFIDYPELAFLLFNKTVPTDMTTPSGSASDCDHPQRYEDKGTTHNVVCGLCGIILEVNVAHTYLDGKCVCGNVEGSSDTPAETFGVITNPIPGTAYKFGMVQENVSASDTYFLTGDMSQTYYFATDTDRENAIDVYLEENQQGSYYLYTLKNGTKTYLNMVKSGNYVNSSFGSTASTVYTYDTAANTVVANVNGTAYHFGTRGDKSYTNVGPVKTSSSHFYCQFYGQLDPCATGHSWTAATCTTPKTCSVCGATEGDPSGEHSFVNGICTGCGAQESQKFTINLMNMSLQNSLQANFALEKSWYDNWEGCYAVITQGDKEPVTVPLADWTSMQITGADGSKTPIYAVPYTGIAAKEMTDAITIVVYNAAGEAISEPYTSTVKDYALRAFANSTNEEAKTMYIDMLCYGAEAQKAKSYKLDNLATDNLTVDQQSYKSAAPDLSDRKAAEGALASRAILESNIQLQVAFDGKYLADGYTAVYTYTDHNNKLVTRTAELVRAANGSTVYATVIVDAMVVADCAIDVEVTILDADGNTVATAKDSVYRWATRDKSDLAAAIVNFSTSAYNFFH